MGCCSSAVINERHSQPRVLPPRSSDASFWARRFVSRVKNELLGVVRYAAGLPELPHAYSHTLPLLTRWRCMWVSVSLRIELAGGDSHPTKRSPRDDFIAIFEETSKSRKTEEAEMKDFRAGVKDYKHWRSRRAGTTRVPNHRSPLELQF